MSVRSSSKKDAVFFYYGFPEWLQTRRPRGPFAVTQALLSSLIITLYVLWFICFVYLVASINKLELNLQLMPNKIIPCPYEIKLTHSDFCCYGFYYSYEDRQCRSLFLFYFFYFYYYGIRTHGVA